MVRLVPVTSGEAPRRLGRAGQVRESADCWAPDPEIERLFHSAASVRELELKAAIGKLELPEAWQDGAEETGFPELPVRAAEARAERPASAAPQGSVRSRARGASAGARAADRYA
jgi:hypothetical protein